MIDKWLESANAFAWATSNILLVYVAILLVVFVAAYYILFDPKATTAGKFIFRFFVSLLFITGLSFVGVFLDPQQPGMTFSVPPDVLWWRPIVRLIGYAYVAYAVTSLAVLLAVRKWWPEKLRTSIDREILQTRQHR